MPLLRPCRNTAAFEVLPDHSTRLALDEVERSLAALGYRRVLRAGVILIARRDVEVSVMRSGKILIKTRDVDVARAVARELAPLLADPGAVSPLEEEGLERLARRALPVPGGA